MAGTDPLPTTLLADFLAALRFFTRIPVPAWVGHSPDQAARTPCHLPAVGVVVGALGAAVTELACQVWPVSLAVILGMAATLLLTGAFHEDGFADVCDGFGGGWTREKVLAIMKDSRVGSYGAMGVALLLLFKWNGLIEIDGSGKGFLLAWAIVSAHAASRFAAVCVMQTLDYAREDESAKSTQTAVRPGLVGLLWAAAWGVGPALFLPLQSVAVSLALATLTTLLLGRMFQRRIGGYTGDCLGAVQQVAEVAWYAGLLCSFG